MFKRKFARTIPDNLRAPHIKMWGFEAKGPESSPELRPEHYHSFFITMLFSSLKLVCLWASGKRSENLGWNFGVQPIPRVAPRVAPRIGFSHKLGRERHSENCSENAREFRELLWKWPFYSESVFFQNWGGSQVSDVCTNDEFHASFLEIDNLFFLCMKISRALVAPYYCAILRYYRCDTPYCAILFKGGQDCPKVVRCPPLVLSFTRAHLCNTPFCNISRDKCAIPHENKHERGLRYCRYKYRAIWQVPFESKLLPAVLLLLRIYFTKITVTVTVLKFGWITITVAVLAPAVAPSFPLTPNYRLESHLN